MSTLQFPPTPAPSVAGCARRGPQWYALYTCSRHEKQVAVQLEQRGVELFLPLYASLRRWKDRRVQLDLPLFPGYVFVHIDLRDRVRVLEVPGTVRFVSFHGLPSALAKEDVEQLRSGLSLGIRAEPHPYLTVGRHVRVTRGPLVGMQGILLRRKDRFRLVLSIDLIMRSIAAEVDACDVEPIS
jgi:transcription antitermination factor NusG